MDKILEILEISPSELFYVEYLKSPKEIIKEMIQDIKSLENDEDKLKTAYKVLKAIIKD